MRACDFGVALDPGPAGEIELLSTDRPGLIQFAGRTPTGIGMTEGTFAATLRELRSRIDMLPVERQAPLIQLMQETIARQREIERARSDALDALDDWRISLKYAVFDAEATRRENPHRPN